MSNVRPLHGIVTKREMFEGEEVLLGRDVMFWKCTVCNKIYPRLEDAEHCCNGT